MSAVEVLAFGSLATFLACAPAAPAPAVSAPGDDSRIAILAALDNGPDSSTPPPSQPTPAAPEVPTAGAALAPAPGDPTRAPRSSEKPPQCTCDPPAVTFTPEQRMKLDRVQKIVDQLNADGRHTKDAAALQKVLNDVASEALQTCASWCAARTR